MIVLASLIDAWHASAYGDEPDWTRFRALVDHLRFHPDEIAGAIALAPTQSGSARIDNLLAAIAEKLADDGGLTRPPWTAVVAPLDHAWSPVGTLRMREREMREAPRQFRARNIHVASDNVWRNRH
jgi:hypothetical protein